ncbi:hypothetical protein [Maridesulfovibrio ferrireducens]|uniref:hypothetical protein n=1 Tax=Maridesulfovibrio ferrireducens TaxID=246191 RepID=UPI001A2131D6|nr:hypothetical protein [Maridesulfovibrio ferrireducens]MBI9113278.1 hypothetical protein [Maridesulfovibrio ferrireducens]
MTNLIKIASVDAESGYSELITVNNAANNELDALVGFQYTVFVEVEGKEYHLCFQTAERGNGMEAYNGYEMELNDASGDDSSKLESLFEDKDLVEDYYKFIEEQTVEAEKLSKVELERLVEDCK